MKPFTDKEMIEADEIIRKEFWRLMKEKYPPIKDADQPFYAGPKVADYQKVESRDPRN